ncbi:MAG: Septum formation initiator [Alphaproteobacteria bacterium ADurb.Bin438]|nr:MAG: Septum formation initiator [Alphaproteobacteria bacterium ADurb.Bin438]
MINLGLSIMLFNNILKKLRFLPLLIAIALSSYFAWHGYYGPRGYKKLQELRTEYNKTLKANQEIEQEKMKLSLKVKNMYSNNIDADLLDEMARKVLNFANDEDIIIFD